jgi:TonB-linked SusC/RagA family outer membrane protein
MKNLLRFSLLFSALLLFITTTYSQTTQISGKVIDFENKQPLEGVTVAVKNSTVSTATNANGDFTLKIGGQTRKTLVFTFVGFNTKEALVNGQEPVVVVLQREDKSLSDVIVVGYGTRRRQDVTGAVTKADLQLQKQSPNANVMSSLRGTVPGLTIGQTTAAGTDPTITVRGRNSISGTTSPLIVVDGLIYRGTLTSINSSDIASIDLLKDASAAAVYGSQASNGVVIITTKTGAGISDNISVDYSGSYSTQDMTKKDMRPATGVQFMQKLGNWYLSESRDPNDMTKMNPSWDPSTKLAAPEAANYKAGYETSWWDLMTNPHPHIQNHNIGLSGRSKKLRFYLGYGYFDQTNLIKNDNYTRNSIRLNVDAKPFNWLTIGAQTGLSVNNYSGVSPTFSDIAYLKPYTLPYDPLTGQMLPFYATTTTPPALEILRRSRDLDKNLNFIGNVFASVDIPGVKGLNYRVNFGNNYISYNRFNYNAPTVEATVYKTYMTDYFRTLDNIITYKRDFGRHGVDVTLLYGNEVNTHDGISTTAAGIINGALSYNRLDGR